jgi:hypothetical protein
MNDLPFIADSGKLCNARKGRKWSPAGWAGNWRYQKTAKSQRTFNYTDLPTFGNRFFASCEDISEFLMRLLSGPCNQGRLAAFQSFIWGTSLPGILRFCELLQGRNPDFRIFVLKRLSGTARNRLS